MAKNPHKTHISMKGVQLNMEAMRAANEQSVAVTGYGSKLRMNARGDTLKEGGLIDRRRETIEQDYNVQLTGNAKRVDVRAVEVDTFETPAQVLERLKPTTEPKAEPQSKPAEDIFENSAQVDPPANVIAKDRARKLIEKDD